MNSGAGSISEDMAMAAPPGRTMGA